ncbi:MAG: hypothetical protein ACFCD0_29165 [Gemmataceae bacterium]
MTPADAESSMVPVSTTRPLKPGLLEALKSLKPGQRVRITQTVRVGLRSWPAVVEGTFRELNSLATGLATDRVKSDDIIVPLMRLTKDNGELTSVTFDENSELEVVSEAGDSGGSS